MKRRRPLAERFWEKVEKLPGDGCWLWTGYRTKGGYGRFGIGRDSRPQIRFAAQVAWELVTGKPFPKGKVSCHECDNPPCVRPDAKHVVPGTMKKNQCDMSKRGRAATGERHGLHLHPETISRGEHRPKAKVTEEQVREIRRIYAEGGIGCKPLGKRYGLSEMAVSFIVRRKSWKHVA